MAFLGEGPLAHGLPPRQLEYTLAPAERKDEIVDEMGRAMQWLIDHPQGFGGDPARLFVAGHSAGGHLTAIAMENPKVAGGLAISGIYDLEPIRLSYLNDKVGMDPDEAKAQLAPAAAAAQGRAAVGDGRRWGAERAAAPVGRVLRRVARPPPGSTASSSPRRCSRHFSIMEELAKPEGRLAALKTLAQRA